MRLVCDANILIAALLKDATTREILLSEDMKLFAPEQLLNEVKHLLKNPKIRRRLKLNDNDLYELTSAILSRIKFIPEKIFLPLHPGITNPAQIIPHTAGICPQSPNIPIS